jgi:hypothetical protein
MDGDAYVIDCMHGRTDVALFAAPMVNDAAHTKAVFYAAQYGRVEICAWYAKIDNALYHQQGLYGAALGGHIHIIDMFLDKAFAPQVANDYAGRGGHIHVINYLATKGPEFTDPNGAMYMACRYRRLACIDALRAYNPREMYAILGACEGKHVDVALMFVHDDVSSEYTLRVAWQQRAYDICEAVIKRGLCEPNRLMQYAYDARLLRWIVELGVTDYSTLEKKHIAQLVGEGMPFSELYARCPYFSCELRAEVLRLVRVARCEFVAS